MTVIGAVFDTPGRLPSLRSFPLPDLRAGEALVRITCCTVCGSDVHSWTGKRSTPLPSILGHEIVGEIEALGPGAPARDVVGDALAVGDRVVWGVVSSCGVCQRCRDGMPQKCLAAWKYGHQAIDDVLPQRGDSSATDAPRTSPLSGGLASHCHLVAGTAIVRVPPALPDSLASTTACAGATVCAAIAAAGSLDGRRVLVTGAGMLGLLACAIAARRAATVTVIDVNPDRLGQARRLGATTVADSVRVTQSFDVLIECTGRTPVTQAAIERLDVGGRAILVGAVFPDAPLAIDAQSVIRRLLTIRGVHNYTPADLAAAVEFMADANVIAAFSPLVAAPVSLADVDCWTRCAEAGVAARTPVVP